MTEIYFQPQVFCRASANIEKTIIEAILDGRLKVGDRLPIEKEMAKQFGVSIVTVREALRSLEIYGLIKKRKGHGGGIFISEANNESIKTSLGYFLRFKDLSIKHIYEVRMIIEPATIRQAAKTISSEKIKELEDNVEFCQKKIREKGPELDKEDFFLIDKKCVDFHRIIAESTNNPILGLTIDYIFDFLFECETRILIPDINYSTNTANDHAKILEYLKQGDEDNCEKEMTLHLEKLKNIYR